MKHSFVLLKEVFVWSAFSIAAPIFFFGGAGWFLDRWFQTKLLFTLSGIAIAFVTTHIFLFRKVKALSSRMRAKVQN